tara:strand:- start:727 stop:1560 length:834 start_codon:yes stop_codon:yes gene_type:complete
MEEFPIKDFFTNENRDKYLNDGYFVVDNIIDELICDKINSYVQSNKDNNVDQTKEIDRDYPFSDIPGTKVFINTIDESSKDNPFNLIDYEKITKMASFLSNKPMKFWLKKVYLKSAFQGDNEVYHQDYEYHISKGGNTDPFYDYIQCFIALEDHSIQGGCLNIIKGSHKSKRIPHDMVMTRNGISKLTVKPDILKQLSKGNNFKPMELKKGSCVFFSYVTLHGSSSNSSPLDQTRMVIQFMNKDKSHDEDKTQEFFSNRKLKEIKILELMLNHLKQE